VSNISTDSEIAGPRFGQAWRAEDGRICGTVRLAPGSNATFLSFDDPADVRDTIAALTETLEAMERLAAEGGSDE
jgi:hypothetical protein